MVSLDLISEARDAGLTITVDGDLLVIRGPKSAASLARRLIDSKAEVLALLHNSRPHVRPPPLRDVLHRNHCCASRRWWLHVWGEFYCADCFPCRDDAALVAAGDE